MKAIALKVLMLASCSLPFGGSLAQAESLSCLIGVYTAKALTTESNDPLANTKVVKVNIVDGAVDEEVEVGGETVWLSIWKFEHADLYNFTAALVTPKADIPARGPNAVAIISDYIYNDGPTKENGWDLNPSPTAKRFPYLQRQVGTFAFSTKLVAALKADGKWGKYPFNSAQIDVQNMTSVVEFLSEQLKTGQLQDSDVVGLSTMFSCTRDN